MLALILLGAVLFGIIALRAEQRNMFVLELAAQVEAAAAERQTAELAALAAVVNDPIRPEAEAAARVVFGMAPYLSPDAWRALACCIINRSEHPFLFENDIVSVCREEGQWMRYSDDSPVLKDIYDVVYEVLSNWHDGGHRIMSPDYIYVSWSETELVFRDEFIETPNTHYWRVS